MWRTSLLLLLPVLVGQPPAQKASSALEQAAKNNGERLLEIYIALRRRGYTIYRDRNRRRESRSPA